MLSKILSERIRIQKPGLTAISLVVALQTLVFLLCDIRFETNDDFFMNAISSGFMGGKPDAHLPYSHFLIGMLVAQLFKWSVAFNWYALYLIGTQCISWLLIFRSLAGRNQPFLHLGIGIGLFVFLEPVYYSHLQFTTTATLAGVAGMMLLHDALRAEKIQLKKLSAGILMLIFASMIRESSAYLAMLLCALPFADFKQFKRNIRPALLLISVFLLMTFVQYTNRLYFEQDSGWSRYYHELKTANRFNDNPAFYNDVVNASAEVSRINGWSGNDLMLFTAFFRSYEPVYHLNAYKSLYERYTKFRPLKFRDFLYAFRTRFTTAFVVMLLLFALYFNQKENRILVILQFVLLIFLAWYIYATLQMKDRALLSMLLAFCVGLLMLGFGKPFNQTNPSKQSALAFFAMLSMLMSGTVYQMNKRTEMKAATETNRNTSRHLLDAIQENKANWLVWGPALPLESLSPLAHSFTYKDHNLKIYPIAAFNKFPLLDRAYGKPLEALLADSGSRVLSMHEPWVTFTPERLDTFYQDHLHCRLVQGGDSIERQSGRRIFWFKDCLSNQAP